MLHTKLMTCVEYVFICLLFVCGIWQRRAHSNECVHVNKLAQFIKSNVSWKHFLASSLFQDVDFLEFVCGGDSPTVSFVLILEEGQVFH